MLPVKPPSEPITNGKILYGPGKNLKKIVFEGLDRTQKLVKKIATIDDLKKKIILIQPYEEELYLSGLRESGVAGYLYLCAHAAPDRIQGMLSGAQVAKVIRDSGIWNNEPILLEACRSGGTSYGIASSLAFSLQTYVTAPTTPVWNYPLGGPAIDQGAFESLPGKLAKMPFPNLTKPGQWRTWGPDGSPISTTRTSPRDQLSLPKNLQPNNK